MNCPFLINENKETTIRTNIEGDINSTVVKHERRQAPCMRKECFYYNEYINDDYDHIVECTRIARRVNFGKDKILR